MPLIKSKLHVHYRFNPRCECCGTPKLHLFRRDRWTAMMRTNDYSFEWEGTGRTQAAALRDLLSEAIK